MADVREDVVTSYTPMVADMANHDRLVPEHLSTARAWIAAIRGRDKVFGGDPFGDPAWNLLLDLYVAHHEQTLISLSSACIAAGVPQSTGLRLISLLRARDLLQRQQDTIDRRKSYLSLTENGRVKVETALDLAVRSDRRLGLARLQRVQ